MKVVQDKDGSFTATVQDGEETLSAWGATENEAIYRMGKLMDELRAERGVCRICGARRDKCCC